MRAIEARGYGGPEVLDVTDRPAPQPGPGQYLVRVSAAGVNPIDWKLRSGTLGPVVRLAFPWVPGCELCGVVEEAGPGATRLARGDRVIGLLDPLAGGATAEYALLDDAASVPRPARLTDLEAAGLSVAGLTALQSLRDLGRLHAGQRVLVNGAAGGVGHLAVQIARALGAHVTAVASGANLGLVRELGAADVIDREREDFRRGPARWDLIFDAVAATSFWECRRVLSRGGTFVSTVSRTPVLAGFAVALLGRRTRSMVVRPDVAGLLFLAGLADKGQLRVVLDRVFPLADAAGAHRRSETGRARGKIVIDVSG